MLDGGGFLIGETLFHPSLLDFQGVGIQIVEEGLAFFTIVGIGYTEEAVEEAHLGGFGVLHGHPVNGGLHLAVAIGHTALGQRVIGAVNLRDLAVLVLHDVRALDDVGVFQTHLTVNGEAVEFLVGIFAEVGTLYPQLLGKRNLTGACTLVLGIVDSIHHLHLILWIVVDDELHRVEDGHRADGGLVEILAGAELEQGNVDDVVAFGHTNSFSEIADSGRRVTSAAQTANSGHARVIPTSNVIFLDELQQFALTHDGVVEVQTRKLNLLRMMDMQCLAEPVVERTVHFELQRADGVRDTLDGVALSVREIVHRIDAPFVASAVVFGVQDAVHDGVAEVHVRRCHVDLSAEHAAAVRELARLHATEQVEVLLHAAVAVRALRAGCRGHSPALADLFLCLIIDISETVLDELLGPYVELVEVVGGVVFRRPLEAQPLDVLADGVHIFGVLLHGVRVVEAQVGLPAIFLSNTEVQTDGLGVADMQIAVRLWRESRLYSAIVFPVLNVFFDNLLNEIHIFKVLRC